LELKRAASIFSVPFAILICAGCERSASSSSISSEIAANHFESATAIVLQDQTGQPPPSWLVLRAGSTVSLGMFAIGGMSVTVCERIDKDCRDYASGGGGEYVVDRVVLYGTLSYAVHLVQLGWVGAGDIAPVIPTGAVLQNRPCSEEPDQDQADCSHDIDSNPDVGGDITHVPDYTLLRVDVEKPGHIYTLHVEAISGPITGTTGFVGEGDDYETPSGYDPTQFVSVVVTR